MTNGTDAPPELEQKKIVYACMPVGVGKPVGYMVIPENDRLPTGFTFTTAFEPKPDQYVLDTNQTSVRAITDQDKSAKAVAEISANLRATLQAKLAKAVNSEGRWYEIEQYEMNLLLLADIAGTDVTIFSAGSESGEMVPTVVNKGKAEKILEAYSNRATSYENQYKTWLDAAKSKTTEAEVLAVPKPAYLTA